MHDFCLSEGIDHQLTAPYTSAQNGRAERLHRTILRKARTMQIACNAPGFLWDEFCSTAAYLTTLTTATAYQGRTPYELWFGRKPSLSHLREIGCRAFTLQMPLPSKIYAQSSPYVLIGYAPHSKAYRLWDPVSSRVLNSYHVTFTKHLDAQPSSFQPGTVLGTDNASSPPSWNTSGPAPIHPHSPAEPSPFSSLPESPPSIFNYDDPSSPFFQPVTQNTVAPSRNTITPSSSETSRNTVPPSSSETSRNTVPPSNSETSRNTTNPSNNNDAIQPPLDPTSVALHAYKLFLNQITPSLSSLNTPLYETAMIFFRLTFPLKAHLRALTRFLQPLVTVHSNQPHQTTTNHHGRKPWHPMNANTGSLGAATN
jgi:hypothetical protein